jgi:two-component system, LytTR family, response regulator
MTTILLDDEPYCLELLAHLLTKHCPDIEIVAQFTEPLKALEFLQNNPAPALFFLDVEMPRLNAFDLLNRLFPFDFKVIFTTAYDKYAVRAIKFSALDYLLKPIDIAELKAAVQKASQQSSMTSLQMELLHHNRNIAETQYPTRIGLSTLEGLDFVEIAKIAHCDASGSYTDIYMINGSKSIVCKTLKEVEELLLPLGFFRIHNSHLINLRCIQRYLRGSGGEVLMQSGKTLPVSRSKKEEFLGLVAKV